METFFYTLLIAAIIYFAIYLLLVKSGFLDKIQSWINSHLR
jgi:cell division protein FtsL